MQRGLFIGKQRDYVGAKEGVCYENVLRKVTIEVLPITEAVLGDKKKADIR